jgi:hypothetical protein
MHRKIHIFVDIEGRFYRGEVRGASGVEPDEQAGDFIRLCILRPEKGVGYTGDRLTEIAASRNARIAPPESSLQFFEIDREKQKWNGNGHRDA